MKIYTPFNFAYFQAYNRKKEMNCIKTVQNSDDNNFKKYSDAITALNKSFITFKARTTLPEKATLLKLLDEGKSEEEIAEIMGYSLEAIHKALLKYGVIKTNLGFIEKNKDKIIELLIAGKNPKEIAEILDCNVRTIYRAQKQFGLKPKSITELNKFEIIKLHREGKRQQEIANTFGISQSGVSKVLISWGIRTNPKTTENFKDIIAQMYQEGSSLEDIAQVFGCNPLTIRNSLVKSGVEIRQRKNIEDDKDKIIDLFNQNKPCKEISRITGYSQTTIHKMLSQWGMTESNNVPRGTTEENKEKILEMRERGCTYKEIAQEIGCSVSTIEHAFIRWSGGERIRRTRENNIAENNKDLIIQLHSEGKNAAAIANILNCDRSVISLAFKRWGI